MLLNGDGCLAMGSGRYLAILVVADPWRGVTVPPIFDTPDTHNPRVNSTADAVLQLDVQFGEGVFGVDTGFADVANRRGFNHVTFIGLGHRNFKCDVQKRRLF
jgi:hypothetical protein